MSEAVGAQKGEQGEGRLGYRSGYYPRGLVKLWQESRQSE
jgi:putative transposase